MYLEIAVDIMNSRKKYPTRVLKTDCHNEAHGRPKGGIVPNLMKLYPDTQFNMLEIDGDLLKRTWRKYPELDIDVFDLRYIEGFPYEKSSFDVIFDFSTLDHLALPRAEYILKEYCSILKLNGILALVVWTSKNPRKIIHYRENEYWNPGAQFIFDHTALENILEKQFQLRNFGSILNRNDTSLIYYRCEKIW